MGKTVRAVSHVETDHAADSNIEAAVNAALAKKEDMFENLLQMQQSTYQACLQSFVEATNKRFDNLVINNTKGIAELRASVHFTLKETYDMKQAVRSQSEQMRANIKLSERRANDIRIELRRSSRSTSLVLPSRSVESRRVGVELQARLDTI